MVSMYRNKLLSLFLPFVISILTATVLTGCVEYRGTIKGAVSDETGQPLAGAIIRAERQGYPAAIFRTDEDGHYELSNIQTGKWIIEFYSQNGAGLGWETVSLSGDETVIVDFVIGTEPTPPDMPRLINVPP